MKSKVKHRSVTIRHRRTSVCVEDIFWNCLKEIAMSRQQLVKDLIEEIDRDRKFTNANLSSAIRLFVFQFYKDEFDRRISEESKVAAQ